MVNIRTSSLGLVERIVAITMSCEDPRSHKGIEKMYPLNYIPGLKNIVAPKIKIYNI